MIDTGFWLIFAVGFACGLAAHPKVYELFDRFTDTTVAWEHDGPIRPSRTVQLIRRPFDWELDL